MNTTTTTLPPKTRPYTSYNLFFQLEREYILQTLLGFQPAISSADLFDPADESNYQGPPLPSRYANLKLPSDWHIPGKTLRRKRIHRKSHGKIGFHELNIRISKGWQDVDDETRTFCVKLSELESKRYKHEKNEKKKTAKKQAKKKIIKDDEPKEDGRNDLFHAFSNWDSTNFPQQDGSSSVVNKSYPLCRQVSHDLRESFNESFNSVTFVSQASSSLKDSFNIPFDSSFNEPLLEVDIEDDEIIEMYNSTTAEEDIPSMFDMCQVCVETSPQSTQCKTKAQDLLAKEQREHIKDGKRMSFIDAEYQMFQEIGKRFSNKMTKIPVFLKRNSITACQA